ncbi:MAG: ATP-binding protein [Deltaproteobacteria bacterium]|nr:ATP-binding protein [Deltaproteobacteria bacterium]
MPIPWERLAPYRPVAPRDDAYIRRPEDGGERLASLVHASPGRSFAVAGPAGIGKTTELIRATTALSALDEFAPVYVPLECRDWNEPLDQVLTQCVEHLGRTSKAMPASVGRAGSRPPTDLARLAFNKLRARHLRVVLLLDGLERAPIDAARMVIQRILELFPEVQVAFILPPSLVTGSTAFDVLAHLRLFLLHAIPTQSEPGRSFFREIVRSRLGLESFEGRFGEVVDLCSGHSGGVPRLFLQILMDASAAAALRGDDFPDFEDAVSAVQDHARSFHRLLSQQDRDALALGIDRHLRPAPPMTEDQQVRFLTHGILLEYSGSAQPVLHPLLSGRPS